MTGQITHKELLEAALESVEEARSAALQKNFNDIEGRVTFGSGSVAYRVEIPQNPDCLTDPPQTKVVIELSDYDQLQERVAVFKTAIANMMLTQRNLSQAMLAALWTVYVEGLIQYDGEYNPDEFMRWVEDSFSYADDLRPIRQLVYIIFNVLQPVYQQRETGDPYIIKDTGEVVTVDMLIGRWGLVSKLREIQRVFTTATREEQERLLDATLNGNSRRDVDAAVVEVRGDDGTMHLCYREIVKETGLIDLILPDLTRDQVVLFRALVGTAGEALI